jgi:hypothetical protein
MWNLPFRNFITFVLNKADAKENYYKEKLKIQLPALKDFWDVYTYFIEFDASSTLPSSNSFMQQKLSCKGYRHKKLPILSECAYIPEIFVWNQYTLRRVSVIVIRSFFTNLDL